MQVYLVSLLVPRMPNLSSEPSGSGGHKGNVGRDALFFLKGKETYESFKYLIHSAHFYCNQSFQKRIWTIFELVLKDTLNQNDELRKVIGNLPRLKFVVCHVYTHV